MSSYVSLYIHVVFSTKTRELVLTPEIRERLFPYLIKTLPRYGAEVASIGGVEDHIHLLLSFNPSHTVVKRVQMLKGSSSKWLNETFSFRQPFRWQEGYAAFSVSVSGVAQTKQYIQNQAEKHRKKTFRQELEEFLEKHGMTLSDYDKKE